MHRKNTISNSYEADCPEAAENMNKQLQIKVEDTLVGKPLAYDTRYDDPVGRYGILGRQSPDGRHTRLELGSQWFHQIPRPALS